MLWKSESLPLTCHAGRAFFSMMRMPSTGEPPSVSPDWNSNALGAASATTASVSK